VGDVLGMAATNALASGMGGIRTAGDLVARMQMSRGMRIKEAKEYVANKLKVPVRDLADSTVMRELRYELGLGGVFMRVGRPKGIEAKFNIARLLGIKINSVNKFKQKAGLLVPDL
jgi:dimethylamine--corrinoid protein Co-methyltransferase